MTKALKNNKINIVHFINLFWRLVMDDGITILQKIKFCKKNKILLKEFWIYYEFYQLKKEEARIRKIIEKAWQRKLRYMELMKRLTRAA